MKKTWWMREYLVELAEHLHTLSKNPSSTGRLNLTPSNLDQASTYSVCQNSLTYISETLQQVDSLRRSLKQANADNETLREQCKRVEGKLREANLDASKARLGQARAYADAQSRSERTQTLEGELEVVRGDVEAAKLTAEARAVAAEQRLALVEAEKDNMVNVLEEQLELVRGACAQSHAELQAVEEQGLGSPRAACERGDTSPMHRDDSARYAEGTNCSVCDANLGRTHMNPRHHCKICCKSVCATCSPSAVRFPQGLMRVCTPCVSTAFSIVGNSFALQASHQVDPPSFCILREGD
jgi:hypothetical protein